MGRIKKLLKGKVVIETLPLVVPSPGQDVNLKGPKRIILRKGELAEVYNLQNPIRHIAYVEFLKGKPRGGHYHTRQEYFYIMRGEMDLEVIDIKTKIREKTRIKEGDLISIPPKISHVINPTKAGHAIEFSRNCFKPKDTIKYEFHSKI